MSVQAMVWAWEQQLPGPGIKATLVALANFADENGSCYPGRDKLAAMTCQSPRTVTRHIVQLADSGYLSCERRHRPDGTRTSNRYRLNLSVHAPAPSDTVTHGPSDTVTPVEGGLSDTVSRHEPSENLEPSEPIEPMLPTGSADKPTADTEQTSNPEPDNLGFDAWWDLYPKRNGRKVGKKAAREKWRKLSLPDRRQAWRATIAYARACNEGSVIARDPARFLAQGYWRDWLEPAADDPLVDAVLEVCGANGSSTGVLRQDAASCAAQLRSAGAAEPAAVSRAAAEFRRRYEDADLTPKALARWWPMLHEQRAPPPKCAACGELTSPNREHECLLGGDA